MEEGGTLRDAIERAAAGERVVIKGIHGEPLVALVSLEDLQYLQEIEAEEDRQDVELADRILADIRAGRTQTVPWEQVKANLGL